jgi:hypothetical protein
MYRADEDEGHAELPEENLEGTDIGARFEHASSKTANFAAPEVGHIWRHPCAAQRAKGGAEQLRDDVQDGFEPGNLSGGGQWEEGVRG